MIPVKVFAFARFARNIRFPQHARGLIIFYNFREVNDNGRQK